MVASIGAVASPTQGVSYYEKDSYYAKDSDEHRAASAWAGKGAAELGLEGPVDPETFRAVLEGEVPDGSGKRLGKRGREGEIHHRPGRDLTFSAPKSVSLAALVGGDDRIVGAHDRAVAGALDWFERNAAETRMQEPGSGPGQARAGGRMVRAGGQKTVIATFRHDTSRNLDPALHTHSVIANMLLGPDGKWRTMANERLYASKMALGALYRNALASELGKLGYSIEKTHTDGRFEIAGVSRETVEAFSTRRAEIEAAMEGRGLGTTAENPHLARRAALMTRAAKREVDRDALGETWEKQAASLGFDAKGLVSEAMERHGADKTRAAETVKDAAGAPPRQPDLFEHAARADPARAAVDWALAHLSERDAVFSNTDLLAAALAFDPGSASIGEIERAVVGLKRDGRLHDAPALEGGGGLTTDKALAEERETVALMRGGERRGKAPMRGWMVERHLRKGPLTAGQKQAVKLILSERDRTVGVQGYAGTGKTKMLARARALAEKKGWRMVGLAPSASAANTLNSESGIGSETLQRFLARNAGVAEGRLTKKGAREMRAAFAKTVLVVDEGSLASTVQARDLLRIAGALRVPKLVLVGDAKQLDAVDAGKPFAQLQAAGMKTAVMLVNSGGAQVLGVRNGRVTFRLEDGRMLTLTPGDPQLRHIDRAWCSTVHAFQGRTVDAVIAAMEANHPALTTQKAFYVEISRARDRAELVTDDAAALKERLEAVTGERISALEGIGEDMRREREATRQAGPSDKERERDRAEDPAARRIEVEREREEKAAREKAAPARDGAAPSSPDRNVGREAPQRKAPELKPERAKGRDLDLGL